MEARYNKQGQKLYPFSMLKNGHNIELAYNHLYLLTHEDEETMFEEGLLRVPDETYDSYDRLSELYGAAIGTPIYWCIGKDYADLKEYSMWAELYRDGAARRHRFDPDEEEPICNYKIRYASKADGSEKEEIWTGKWSDGMKYLQVLRKQGYAIKEAAETNDQPAAKKGSWLQSKNNQKEEKELHHGRQ